MTRLSVSPRPSEGGLRRDRAFFGVRAVPEVDPGAGARPTGGRDARGDAGVLHQRVQRARHPREHRLGRGAKQHLEEIQGARTHTHTHTAHDQKKHTHTHTHTHTHFQSLLGGEEI